MAALTVEKIRNVALIGHSGAGKTSLAEALLHKSGATNRLGSVQDQTSILDSADDEKEKLCSIDTALCYFAHNGQHVNLIDTPGGIDYCGQAIAGMSAAETAVLVVSATSGIEVNTRKMMERATKFGLARMIVINKVAAENVTVEPLIGQLQEMFGAFCLPVNLPAPGYQGVTDCFARESGDAAFGDVESAHLAVVEAVVGADEELMEKYLGGEVSQDELVGAAAQALAAGELVPVLFTDARAEMGIAELLDALCTFAPTPLQGKKRTLRRDGEEIELDPQDQTHLVAQVFSVGTRANIKYSAVRVYTGKLTSDLTLHTVEEKRGLRPGQLHRIMGADFSDLDEAIAGDIVALAKVDVKVGDTLFTGEGGTVIMPPIPKPMCAKAITPKSRGDEEKVSGALKRFTEEDPAFEVERVSQTHELVVRGIGDLHLQTVLQRMAKQFKLEVDVHPPKIPYRETITAAAREIEYTHKKQTGGAGQFARVVINLLPSERGAGYEFVDKIFGGTIDIGYRPSVDKGVRQQMQEGVLAGYPVVDVTVELIDGKTHPVDSKDIAFQIAGRGVFKDAFMKAKPTLLEPIVTMEVTVPTEFVGDIQGDLAGRRGRPLGQDSLPGNLAVIKANVPLAEVSDYNSRLSSITGGQGSFSMELSHYEQVPANVQRAIVEAAKSKDG